MGADRRGRRSLQRKTASENRCGLQREKDAELFKLKTGYTSVWEQD